MDDLLTYLENKAIDIRKDVIESLCSAGSGHLGGSLSSADILTTLFFHVMNHRPNDPKWKDRDRFILSIGHIAPVLYATLAEAGYFPKEELLTLRKIGSRLQGHPGIEHGLPGIEVSSGSLGQGLGIAVGIALMQKKENNNSQTFCLLGDGELQEGSVWEAAMSAAQYKLNMLTAIVDRNGLQIDGRTEDVMALEPLSKKWESFGWNVFECDGNNITELIKNFSYKSDEKPKVIIANTKMGCGVSEIENDYSWHGKVPNETERDRFLNLLQ